MDNGLSTVRNLLWIIVGLTLLSIAANVYVGTELARNSDELDGLRQVLAKQLTSTALEQSQQLQNKMEQLNQDAAGIDAKLQAAQDRFVAKMDSELPKIMDNYLATRGSLIERQAMKQIPR